MLKQWILQNGGYIHKNLKIINNNVSVTDDIKKNEILVKLPTSVILNQEKFENIPNIQQWYGQGLDDFLNDHINRLIIFLIYEKHLGRKSFYYPYISSLPLLKYFKKYPLCNITTDNLELWKELSLFFYNDIIKYKNYIQNFYNNITYLNNTQNIIETSTLPKTVNIGNETTSSLYALILWGFLIYHNKSLNNKFLPYLDLFQNNHGSPEKAVTTRECVSTTLDLLKKHDNPSINFNYNKNNFLDPKNLLCLHNFHNNSNYMNVNLDLRMEKPDDISICDKVVKDLTTHDSGNKKYQFIENLPSDDLIHRLRIMLLTENDISIADQNQERSVGGQGGAEAPPLDLYYKHLISVENELDVYSVLLRLIVKLRKIYIPSCLSLCDYYKNDPDKIISTLSRTTLVENDIIDKTTVNVQKNLTKLLNLQPINLINIVDDHKNNKLIHNLTKGLKLLNIRVDNNMDIRNYTYIYSSVKINLESCPSKRIIFSNFTLLPHNIIEFNNKYKNAKYSLTSNYLLNIWNEFKYDNLPLVLLPISLDVNTFLNYPPAQRVGIFVYYKKRSYNELDYLLTFLKMKNIDFKLIIYDKNIEDEVLPSNNKYAIWLSCHESENYPLLETLATNTPILVWNVKNMNQEINCPYLYNSVMTEVTSIPHWDNRCGMVFWEENELDTIFEKFISNLNNFQPREFISEKLDIKENAKKFVDIFTQI